MLSKKSHKEMFHSKPSSNISRTFVISSFIFQGSDILTYAYFETFRYSLLNLLLAMKNAVREIHGHA